MQLHSTSFSQNITKSHDPSFSFSVLQTSEVCQRVTPPLLYMALFPRSIRLLRRAIARNFRGSNTGLARCEMKFKIEANLGLGIFLRLDAGYKYNDETGINSIYWIRDRTAKCRC